MGLFAANWLVERINREHVRQAAGQYARGRVLDVGSGQRPYAEFFAEYTGLEIDRVRYAETPADVWGSALALPFGDQSFETILSSQVLEHVPEPWQMVEEMARVLKPGGHLILTAPHIWGLHEVPHDYFRFTCYGLEYLARRAGLEPIEVLPMAGYWVTAGVRFCYYLKRFERGIFKPLVRLLYAVVQLEAWALDRIHRVESDTWNYLLVARRIS
jgi:ubiquinone/menaquinone biosynthesis C-methylase UbiE